MLDPQAQALITLIEERGIPPVWELAPEAARQLYRERRFFTQPEPPPLHEVRALALPGPAGALAARLYRPGDQPRLPLLVYFHGGGWTIGDLDTHDVLCRQLALGGGCAVLSVDYRLAPEHRFPAAVDDCHAATRWACANADALGVDARRIAVGGDSAGGNLAAVVALLLRDGDGPRPCFQLLIYPATDMRAIAASHRSNGSGYLLTRESIAYYRGHYTPEPASWSDWRASPLLAADHARLPPALVLTAGHDPLRDEGRQYADALSRAGNAVHYVCFERNVHGFVAMPKAIDEGYAAIDLCCGALRRAFTSAA